MLLLPAVAPHMRVVLLEVATYVGWLIWLEVAAARLPLLWFTSTIASSGVASNEDASTGRGVASSGAKGGSSTRAISMMRAVSFLSPVVSMSKAKSLKRAPSGKMPGLGALPAGGRVVAGMAAARVVELPVGAHDDDAGSVCAACARFCACDGAAAAADDEEKEAEEVCLVLLPLSFGASALPRAPPSVADAASACTPCMAVPMLMALN